MPSERYRQGATIPIFSEVQIDSAGVVLSALGDVLLRIRRVSDGFFYDFADDTFKAAGHTDIDRTMTAVASVGGVYETTWDTSLITNAAANDQYLLDVDSATSANFAAQGVVYLGDYVEPVYQAKVVLIDDDSDSFDRYVVEWFRDTEPVTSGITLPTIQVVKSSDGSNLIASSAMTEFGTHHFKFDTTLAAQRVTDGDSFAAIVTITHNGAVRTFRQPVGRDSEA